jgi:hypothetical protein
VHYLHETIAGGLLPAATDPHVLALEADWERWLRALFPSYTSYADGVPVPFGEHHRRFWTWLWAIERGVRPDAFFGIWPRGGAKALAVGTPIPTPDGWTTMGVLRPGDMVFNHRGMPTRVDAVSGVYIRPCFRLRFADGASIVASDDHRWAVLTKLARHDLSDGGVDWALDSWPMRLTRSCAIPTCSAFVRKGVLCSAHVERHRRGVALDDRPVLPRAQRGRATRQAQILTSAVLAQSVLRYGPSGKQEHRLSIPLAQSLALPMADLPLAPYVLGVWLGDGHTKAARVTVGSEDREVMTRNLTEHMTIRVFERPDGVVTIALPGVHHVLRDLGVLGAKHIPAIYLRAGESQRRDLLRGLLDTDGTPGSHGRSAVFTSTNERLARGCAELARSLGYRAVVRESRASLYGRDWGPVWDVQLGGVRPDVFGLDRKAESVRERSAGALRWSGRMHYLAHVERVPDQPVQCITVDDPSGMFLAGEAMIPTHNSTSAEMGIVALGARGRRRYGWYVSGTEDQADAHLGNIADMLESRAMARFYPDMADRAIGKYGTSKGWRRNRLRTRAGFTVDALGLDKDVRGMKLEEQRPDFLVFDDIDAHDDTPAATDKKIAMITHKLLPAGAPDVAVLGIQNLVIEHGVFGRVIAGAADFLRRRVVSGPVPAVIDLAVERGADGYRIVGGTPTWAGQDLETVEEQINDWGLSAFLAEAQHEIEAPAGGMFDHLEFRHVHAEDLDPNQLLLTVVWVDPAVTDKDGSDAHGIQADSLGIDGTVYRRYSWERRSTPRETLKRALQKAVELGAAWVGVETDQGGDTWQDVYRNAWEELVREGTVPATAPRPAFREEKAGAGYGNKVHRAQQMLADYERGRIVHVLGTHVVLERALRRFPKSKPYDLVDASFWAWRDLQRYRGPVQNRVRELRYDNARVRLEETRTEGRVVW